MKIGFFNAIWVLLGVPLAGCTTPAYCDALDKCGGDFNAAAVDLGAGTMGTEWVAGAERTDAACIDQVPSPPDPPSLALIPPRPAGVRPIEQSTIEWCAGLVLKSDGTIGAFDDGWYEALKRYNGWFPSVPLYTGQLTLHTNNQYAMTTTQLVSQHVELSATCLVAQGVVLTCDDAAAGKPATGQDLTTQLQKFVQEKLDGIKVLEAQVYGNVCAPGADGSCTCDYNISLTTTTSGPWQADNGGHLSFYDAAAAPPCQADYCARSGSLQLSGSKQTDLFNRTSLKTLNLAPPSCADKVQSSTLGETGIDCGGQCPACP